jgi:hypothetical protein
MACDRLLPYRSARGHVEQCTSCGTIRHVYHSCRNRHCPKCQNRAKEQWVTQRHQDLLPVPYYHLVFTLPHVINPLAGAHFRCITDVLFKAVSDTLLEFGANPHWLGGKLAFSLVLHTWSQNLMRHLHVHALVAGGALTTEQSWITGRRGFLFPVKALSKVFRGKFIGLLTERRDSGCFKQSDANNNARWNALLAALRRHDWVVYAKQPLGGPAQVLEYLSRYTHRVAISNERLVRLHEGQVAFKVRDNANAGKKRMERLPADAFIGRFLLHVLPPGLKRIRHYGILASCHKQAQLAACRAALQAPQPDRPLLETVAAFMQRVVQLDITCCPRCHHGKLRVVEVIPPTRCPGLSTGPPP